MINKKLMIDNNNNHLHRLHGSVYVNEHPAVTNWRIFGTQFYFPHALDDGKLMTKRKKQMIL